MKKIEILFLLLAFTTLLSSQNLQIGGYIQADDRFKLKDRTISWEEYRLALMGQVEFEKSKFYSEIWIRNFGSSNVKKLFELSDKNYVEPVSIEIREAYVDLKDFVIDNLDLKIGRQRIAWGTADKLNPTDNLNPDDLEDIWDYGRHLGSNAIKLSYYLGDFTITGVFIPTFTPSVLPKGDWIKVFASEFFPNSSHEFENLSERVIVVNPENSLKEASKFGLKISKRDIFGFDLSMSYVYGRDDIPMPFKAILPVGRLVPDSVYLFFPRMRVVGIDFAGDIRGVGVWGEAGIFYPEEVNFETVIVIQPTNLYLSRKILEKKNYTRFVLGFDYTFENGIYANVQYLHGFLHERGRGNLKNYLVFNFERKFMDDKLKINFLSGGVEFKRAKDIRNNYSLIYNPQITYNPIDNLELAIGGRIIDGKGSTTFGRLRDRDEIYIRVKYSF
ncbi:MAG: hypothetical protein N2252_06820 [Candidatus Kryptonium sp.]|nr:hypothetical protein [Candidatus Kryptonium sp.]MCX7762537.1 hypothetical protein [Candidatus Kryptonium sp.]